MLLGDFNSIYIGDTSIDAVYIGSNLVWSSNPSSYTQLIYIQSTNRQTINTGYIPNENSRIEAEFMLYTSYFNEYIQALFGNKSWELIYNRSQTLRTEYRFGSGSVSSTTAVLPYHKRFRLVCDKDGAAWYDNDGIQLGSVSVTGTSPSASSLFIGSTTNVDYGCYRIYSFKIYENDTLVMSFIPVQRNEDGVCGLLDTISGDFFVDAGSQGAGYYSDKFEDSYTQLEAVETSGNLYVDTDYILNASTRIVIDSVPKIAGSSDGEILLGCTNNVQSGTDDFVINTEYRSSPYLPYYQRGGAFVFFDSVNSMERRSTIEIYQNDVTIEYEDGTSEQYTVSGTPSSYTSPVSLYLFALHYEAGNYTSTSHARFYNCKIEEIESDIVKQIHNFIPVKRKFDNIIVLYDTVSNSEYPPVGGAFTEYSVMPIMDGITNYYDCKRDVTIGGYWKSQVKFYDKSYDMPLGGNISIADDGSITMTGDSSGYAWFYSATADYTTRSAYVIAKADASTIHSQNPVLLGVSSAGGDKNTVSISTQRNTSVLDLDLWGANVESVVNSSDYHVCVWTRNGSINSFYVDGVLIGTLDVSNKYYVTYSTYQGCEEQLWGVACLFRGNSYNSWGDKVQKYFKFIAIADTAHTSEQIAENTAWLKKYYNLD